MSQKCDVCGEVHTGEDIMNKFGLKFNFDEEAEENDVFELGAVEIYAACRISGCRCCRLLAFSSSWR
jgi:hypothetical protein